MEPALKRAAKRLGLPTLDYRFHDLRHTCISRLVANGADVKLVQALAGHSNPTITLKRYSQLADARITEAASRFDPARGSTVGSTEVVEARERTENPHASSGTKRARSNPQLRVELARLSLIHEQLLASAAARPRAPRPAPPRPSPVLETITLVLARAGQPIRACQIHAAAKQLAGEPLLWTSVKAALAAGTSGQRPRFQRVGHGVYQLAGRKDLR